MESLLILIPVSLLAAGVGLAAFLWSLRSGQFDDLEGPGYRVLMDDDKLGENPGEAPDLAPDLTPDPDRSADPTR